MRTWSQEDALRQRLYRYKLRGDLEALLGLCCQWFKCRTKKKLEFAHLKPTGLKGRGRGMQNRLLDVKKHPDHYTLLCRRHHLVFDNGKISIQFKSQEERHHDRAN